MTDEDFATLGVQPDADMVVIDAAFHALMTKHRGLSDAPSRERVRCIKVAYARIQAERGRGVLPAVSKRSERIAVAIFVMICVSGLLAVGMSAYDLPRFGSVTPSAPDSGASGPVADEDPVARFEQVRPRLERRPTLDGTLSVEGLGPARIGMSIEDVQQSVGSLNFRQDFEACKVATPVENTSVSLLFEYGLLTRVSVYGPNPAQTPRGIRIGSTTEQVRAAYGPDLIEEAHVYAEAPAQYLTYLLPESERGGPGEGVRFETDPSGRVVVMHGGRGSLGYIEGCL